VQADAGTLKDEDLRFIKSLRAEIPKLFVVNKADTKTDRELTVITAHLKSLLTLNGIPYVNVLTFSRNKPAEYDAAAIRSILDEWNQHTTVPDFAKNFKQLFINCRNYFEESIDYQRRRMERLNTAIIKMDHEDAETIEPLRELLKDAKERVDRLKSRYENLHTLKDMLFSALKQICDQIGIYMPEPSEVDMREDVPDTLAILMEYKKTKGIKNNPKTAILLRETFAGITPAFDKAAGGGARRDAVIKIIKDIVITLENQPKVV
jgi:signal recognition particle receptor subunit beta